jgi:hypothetical protein
MIEEFASARGMPRSKFLNLNQPSRRMLLVSLMIPKFAGNPRIAHRRTSESGH